MCAKRLVSALLAMLMIFSLSFAASEDFGGLPADSVTSIEEFHEVGDVLYYTGGVVSRGYLKGAEAAASDELLQLAYLLTNTPYIILEQPTVWELTISGGTEPYEVMAALACQEDLSMDQFADPWYVIDYFDLTEDEFEYTFTGEGRYFWEFSLSDSSGQFFTFQTRIYEAYSTQDEGDSSTVVGKVNSLVESLITDSMSDYTRAKVLHDWLIYNANYDYTYTYYDASGVLLHGTGVCDSYARAYLMLCTAAGLECVYVTGTAGEDADPANWVAHGWNLVKLNGSWYHVDCTWDDPNEGGYENHNYFCVDDATIAVNHRWNRPGDLFEASGMIVPEAEGGEYEAGEAALGDYDFTFTSMEEYEKCFDAMVAAGEYRDLTIGKYIGTADLTEIADAFDVWYLPKAQELANEGLVTSAGYQVYGDLFMYNLGWVNPDDYVRITEDAALVGIGETTELRPYMYYPEALVGTWTSSDPSIATVTAYYNTDSSDAIEDGLYAVITGISAGAATIAVTTDDGLSDSIVITVLPAYTPDFALAMTEAEDGVTLAWDGVPGVTEYQVMRADDSGEACLLTTADTNAVLTASQLPANIYHDLYVVGQRKIGSTVYATYTSDAVVYVRAEFSYTAILPANTTVIEAEAFKGDTSLTAVSLPDGVTTIGANAFGGCTALEAVSIPESVTSIGAGAFDSTLKYAEVVKGSYAEEWLTVNLPDVVLFY